MVKSEKTKDNEKYLKSFHTEKKCYLQRNNQIFHYNTILKAMKQHFQR